LTNYRKEMRISANELLQAREERAARRIRFQTDFPGTCLGLSLNIPGAEKDSPRIRALFRQALLRIHEMMSISAAVVAQSKAGPHAVLAVAGTPEEVEGAACRIEREKDYGRLLDLDVYDSSGVPVSSSARPQGRACFLCGDGAAVCMREKRHTLAEIMSGVERLFVSFRADMSRNVSRPAAYYASLGLEALLYETAAVPSPGLVDPLHTGSHNDMDFFTFQRSSAALAFSLARCAEAGMQHDGSASDLLAVLRVIGLEAETDMFRATSGVNTHKGLLFSMGLALGAAGLLLRDDKPVHPQTLCATLQEMTAGIVGRELGGASGRTDGERMYRDFGISGVRGEMEAGLPSVRNAGLPVLEKALSRGEECNRALIRALIALMAKVDDTTILARSSSLETLRDVQAKADELHRSGRLDQKNWRDAIRKLDRELVLRNLSPGGSADMLALTWFLHRARSPMPYTM
jgi:holo-ACP synthase/triphosphoribosyl-dephospho-CoA synthase